MKMSCQLNSFDKKRDGVQNAFVKSFLTRSGQFSSVRDLLHKIDTMKLFSWKAGSGRPRTVRTVQNTECVAELISSQEDHVVQQKSLRYCKVDRNTQQFCTMNRGFR